MTIDISLCRGFSEKTQTKNNVENSAKFCSVVIASRDENKVANAAKEMGQLGNVWSSKCNIRLEEDVRYRMQPRRWVSWVQSGPASATSDSRRMSSMYCNTIMPSCA